MISSDEKQALSSLLSQLIMHSEAISWERFYYYLVAISLLGIAWATVYAGDGSRLHREPVLASFGVAGMVLSLLWSWMGTRSRRFLDMYRRLGVRVEIGDNTYKNLHGWLEGNTECVRNTNNLTIYKAIGLPEHSILPFAATEIRMARLNRKFTGRIASSTVLLQSVPLIFTGLFGLLTYASVVHRWLYLLILLALSVVVACMRMLRRDPLARNEEPRQG